MKLDPQMMRIFGIFFGLGTEVALTVVGSIYLIDLINRKLDPTLGLALTILFILVISFYFFLRIKKFRATYRK